jgi:hypothetical protein
MVRDNFSDLFGQVNGCPAMTCDIENLTHYRFAPLVLV